MFELDAETIIASILLTWGIGLAPPLAIRYVILKRPIKTLSAIGICALFWFLNVILFTALGSQSKTHGALALVALVSFWLLRKPSTVMQTPPAATSNLNSTTHPGLTERKSLVATEAEPRPAINQSTEINEEDIYASIAQELETGVADKGLWTRLFAESGGDEKQTKVLYIKQRAERLIAAERLRLEQAARERAAEAERTEKLRTPPSDTQQMEEYGITFDGERYTYGEYKYDKLSDAISYAKLQNKRSV